MHRFASRAALMLVVLLAAAAGSAQTVDEIVAMNLKSKGGADKWKAIDSVKMSGSMTAQGMDLEMTVYARRPNHTRQELHIKGTTLVQAFDGTTGWIVNPLMGGDAPQEMPAPLVDMMRNTADFDGPLVDYKAKGHTVGYVGREKVGDAEAHHLKITLKSGDVQHSYLDASTGLELRKSQEIDPGTGQTQTLQTDMSDYRPVDGVMVAHSIRQLMNGEAVAQVSIDTVQFNAPDVQDAIFRMPGK
jgi:outer membrane lipoprotein-sorting protein